MSLPDITDILKGQDVAALDAWIAAGGDIHQPIIESVPPLHFALISNNPTMVKALVERRVNLEQKSMAMSALQFVVCIWTAEHKETDKAQLCEILLKAGANPNSRNDMGLAPLDDCAVSNFPVIAKVLQRHGAEYADPMNGVIPFGAGSELGDVAAQFLSGQSGPSRDDRAKKLLLNLVIAAGLCFLLYQFGPSLVGKISPSNATNEQKVTINPNLKAAQKATDGKRYKKSLELANEVLENSKISAERLKAREILALNHFLLEDWKAAKQQYQILLKTKPDNQTYKNAIESVELKLKQ